MRRATLFITLAVMIAASQANAKPKEMSLQLQQGHLRKSPAAYSKIVGSAAYGERFVVLEERGAWIKIKSKTKNVEGWIREDALVKKKLDMKAGGEIDDTVSGDELAAAAKGFNEDVEKDYRQKNKDIDFTWVDKMANMERVPPDEALQFLKAGGVTPKEGGAE